MHLVERKQVFKEEKPQLLLLSHEFEGKEYWFYDRIRPIFGSTVDPLQLSEYLVEQNCLTDTDLQKIQEIFKLKGKLFAATELLSRLQRRPYWIHYIKEACSRPELGLNELKILIEVKMIRDTAERKVLFKGEKTEALSYLQVSDYVERGIKEEVRGSYDEISTEISDKLEQTDEQIALNWEQLELGRLRPPVSFTHKMMSPDLKDLFHSVESAFCVPEDTEQLSFAANLLKAVHSDKIASEIKLLSDRLEFLDCSKVFGNEDPGTVCALDVDIVFNKDHLGVVKMDPIQGGETVGAVNSNS
uniref:Caspase recruitment domain-containing protein n=1 Tax=Magallana gigas TaxID=29159 RepID=A0A8W8M6I1_MAGGI